MEADCAQESLYAQLDRLEQSLDSELNELHGFLSHDAQQEPNEAQENNDIDSYSLDVDDLCESNTLFFKNEACLNETCIVKSTSTRECHGEIAFREAFYKCGTHSYRGEVALDLQHAFDTKLEDISVILSMLQQQQNDFVPLHCSENDSPESHIFHVPLHDLEMAQSFLISEVSSVLSVDIEKLDPAWQVYFELVGDTSSLFQDVAFACSRFYSKGVAFIFLYFEGVLYSAIQNEPGLGLLDVDFQAYFTGENEGSTLAMYNDTTWMKLSAWKRAHVSISPNFELERMLKPSSNANLDLVSDGYVQSYYILKPDNLGTEREVMFRFGSWLYSGVVDLPAMNSLQEIPKVIREMRLNQHKLEFVGDVSSLPASNKFVKPMQYSTNITKYMEREAASCEEYLYEIMSQADVDEKGKHWLEDDATTCFFEFACERDAASPSSETLEAVELVCNKVYNASGVISISIYHQGRWYVLFEETSGEIALLDSKFPDLSTKINGCQLKTYPRGIESWYELRSLSLWQATLNPVGVEKVPVEGVVLSTNESEPKVVKETKQRKRGSLPKLMSQALRRKNR
mmetsp:Transcript_17899/g.30289  ORF Transcript_17899/g.30289 Transcript_17899/m.30289 type:complete len:571 (-) Transcript_17899:2153-3865(-)